MGVMNRRRFLGLAAGGIGALLTAIASGGQLPKWSLGRTDQLGNASVQGVQQADVDQPRWNLVPTEGAYWGVLQYNIPYELAEWDELEASVEKNMSVVHFGWPWRDSQGFMPFPRSSMEIIRERAAIPCINWCTWELGQGASQPAFLCRVVANGEYDDYIRRFAVETAAWEERFIIRLNHEMNIGGQFPWNFHREDNTAEEFVEMWRHVHAIFAEEGATNVDWFWCANVWWPGSWAAEPNPAYPGDDYVDWVGIDGFNWDTMSFEEIFSHSYEALSQLAPDKPIAIGEFGTHEGAPIDKAAWIANAFHQIETQFPRIRMALWFNEHESGDWPIDSSPESTSAFRGAIASPHFLSGEAVVFATAEY